jgi:hypothetical protein
VRSHHFYLSIYLSPTPHITAGFSHIGLTRNPELQIFEFRYINGAFGASRINITSFVASSTASDSVFGAGDLLTVTFSEPTNQVRFDDCRMLRTFRIPQYALYTRDIALWKRLAGQKLPDRDALCDDCHDL